MISLWPHSMRQSIPLSHSRAWRFKKSKRKSREPLALYTKKNTRRRRPLSGGRCDRGARHAVYSTDKQKGYTSPALLVYAVMDAPSLHIKTLYIRGAAAIRVQGYFKIDSRRANAKKNIDQQRLELGSRCQLSVNQLLPTALILTSPKDDNLKHRLPTSPSRVIGVT